MIIVDTAPVEMRNKGSINLGLLIASKVLDANIVHWTEVLKELPEKIGFNIFWHMNIFNAMSFLLRNGIDPLNRKVPVLFGGQGSNNISPMLRKGLADEIYYGEADGDYIDEKGWHRASVLNSEPVYYPSGKKAAIELTRGCKYRCKFCEYGWTHGGKYREKEVELVKSQIDEAYQRGVQNINFMSANFAGYTKLEELADHCMKIGVKIMNTDICLSDLDRIIPLIDKKLLFGTLKIGIESFCEKTRFDIGKRVTQDEFLKKMEYLVQKLGYIHFYLIYGLPNDDYDEWFKIIPILSKLRKGVNKQVSTFWGKEEVVDRPIRFEFSITNFFPTLNTPYENAPIVNWEEKLKFLDEWEKICGKWGFYTRGRIGRGSDSYQILTAIVQGNSEELLKKIAYVFPNGIGRSIRSYDGEAWHKWAGEKPEIPLIAPKRRKRKRGNQLTFFSQSYDLVGLTGRGEKAKKRKGVKK